MTYYKLNDKYYLNTSPYMYLEITLEFEDKQDGSKVAKVKPIGSSKEFSSNIVFEVVTKEQVFEDLLKKQKSVNIGKREIKNKRSKNYE